MREKVLAHMGSLMGGMVHNLNTPLMWIMGRAQLIQSRNEKLDSLTGADGEELSALKAKNSKDIASIQDGADKIDHMLKSLGYKIQMINEGYTSIELREFLEMETDFLMADMRFKHETERDVRLDCGSCYVKCDYNALSYALTGIINTVIGFTQKGRKLQISLENGAIRLTCPDLKLTPEVKREVENVCQGLKELADIAMDGSDGFEISLWIKDQ
ncbi:MAG: hypothetical protein BWZ01_00893 [Deltaproteobacteria bacterium ADurb.BinA179]|jgi:signal transduction histidine kinase|nr:HAMP domain-containing histidine kinase [Deltaproteobacteria bacterium]MDI9543286.1 histidine kinase dimerization/phospho-acceptor domain-containing protein [Pseudomonadota bacterium]OPZ28975.1 MAG: hypothetical protein BWZ01_00893 [Deltaproteobacteria bacterium ADurb.BinA179]HRR21563.1 histidine kinase dimerization/phospho-acceptor domain-containing protein [Desulfomonilia bacterium]HNU74119.1 histidine kinase dimerization/phospho-acceptor domain-containing protein [Deltaproteobacteria bact